MIEQILQADRLLQVDRVADARGMFERVVELDPRNAIAIVGLAQCELADGNEAGAHALAARALTVDPENDMARRMEARLSEVLAMRGADVARPAASATPGAREIRPIVTGDAVAADAAAKSPSAASPAEQPRSLLHRLLGR